MIKIEFEGWVEKIFDPTKYDQAITVRNYKDNDTELTDKKEYPVCYKFIAKTKDNANEQLNGICEGDKVKITAFLYGRSGVSSKTNNYYCMNDLIIQKKEGIKVLEKSKQVAGPISDGNMPDDMPF